jgi:hypothetical protein
MPENNIATDGVTNPPTTQPAEAVNNPQNNKINHPNNDVKPVDNNDNNDKKPENYQSMRWGDYEIPVSIYEEMKRNFYAEGKRKTSEELSPRLKTDEDIQALNQYQELQATLGQHFNPDNKNIDFDRWLESHTTKATQAAQKTIKDLTRQKQELEERLKQTEFNVANANKMRLLAELSVRMGVAEDRIGDFIRLEDIQRRVQMRGDNFDEIVILDENGNTSYNSNAEKTSIEDLLKEILGQKKYFLSANETSGAGGRYGGIRNNDPISGPPHLRNRNSLPNKIEITKQTPVYRH